MELDFSKLENIAQKPPKSEQKGGGAVNTPTTPENATQGKIEGLQAINLNREQEAYQNMLTVYKNYQNNIRCSSQLQTEILKGLKAGESLGSLFLKAMEAISNMTGNELLYTQAREDLKAVYGLGLQEREPLEIERQEVADRLKRLEAAEKREREADGCKVRISAAVKAHRQRLAQIDELIKAAR